MKKIRVLVAFLLIFALVFAFSACEPKDRKPAGPDPFVNPGDNLGGGGIGEEVTEAPTDGEKTVTDATDDVDLSDVKSNVVIDGAVAVTATTEQVVIKDDGSYVFSGEYPAGIQVKKNVTAHLFFNGVTVNTADKALEIKGGANVVLTVVEGSVNTLTSTTKKTVDSASNLTINGTGTLNVSATAKVADGATYEEQEDAVKNAIGVDGALTVVDVVLNVSATKNAVSAYSITAENCTVNVTSAGKDGLHAEMDDSVTAWTDSDGFVYLKNVNYTANVSGDGIQADTFVYVNGGNYNVTTTATFVAKSTANQTTYGIESDDWRYVKSGSTYKKVDADMRTSSTLYAMIQSSKGIKVGEIDYDVTDETTGTVTENVVTSGNYQILIEDGTFVFNTSDDCIHANSGSVTVNGGNITASTLDDAITADVLLKFNGGTVNVTACYEGLEGTYVEVTGGTVKIKSTDDGLNAANKTTQSVTPHLLVSGGKLEINAGGDGLDSNGSLQITGGEVIVYGPTDGGNASLDADKGILVDGGYLFACGSLGMVETPSQNSKQYVVSYANRTSISAGSVLTVTDSNGNVIAEVTTPKTCQSLIISCPEFTNGSSYSIYNGQTLLATFTISSQITSVGTGAGGGMGPGGGPGGHGGGWRP